MKLFEMITEETSGHKRLVSSIISRAEKLYGRKPNKFAVEHYLKVMEKDTSFYDRIRRKAKKVGANDPGWIAYHYQFDEYVSPIDYFDYLSKQNAMRKKKINSAKQSKQKNERFYIIDDFGKRRSFTKNELNMIFTNDNDVIAKIRENKLNTLNI